MTIFVTSGKWKGRTSLSAAPGQKLFLHLYRKSLSPFGIDSFTVLSDTIAAED